MWQGNTNLADHNCRPDHVCETKLGGGQTKDLAKNVQPSYDPSDDGAVFTGYELRRRGIPRVKLVRHSNV